MCDDGLNYESDNTINDPATDPTPLHDAAANGDVARLEQLLFLANNHGVSACLADGRTPLHLAAANGHVPAMELLVARGADINKGDGDEYSPLHLATDEGQHDAMVWLIANGADVEARASWFYGAPLHFAAYNNDDTAVEILMCNGGADPDVFDDDLGHTPLQQAISEPGGHIETVRALIKNGASIETRSLDGTTALHLAAETGNIELTNLLLSLIASRGPAAGTPLLDATTTNNLTALHYAVRSNVPAVVASLISYGAALEIRDTGNRHTPLDLALSERHSQCVPALLAGGAKLDVWSLNPSAINGNVSEAKLLLAEGACITDKVHRSPLENLTRLAIHYAAENGSVDVLRALLDAGADPDPRSYYVETPLHLATKKGHREVIIALMEEGVDLDMSCGPRWSPPLCIAATEGNTTIMEFLIASGAKINAQQGIQWSRPALHCAAASNQRQAMRLLLTAGADVNAGCPGVHSSLLTACGDLPCIKLLLDFGANINVLDVEEVSPLLNASYEGNATVVQALLDCGAEIQKRFFDDLHEESAAGGIDCTDVLDLLMAEYVV